jgi:hypothetical protein
MMNVKGYYENIEKMLESRKSSKTSKSSRKGLLAQSSSDTKATGKKKNDMIAIVEIIEGIREAREELTNGTK